MTVSHEQAVEVDTQLAELWDRQATARYRIAQTVEALHSSDGQRKGWDRRAQWPVDDETTEANVRAKLADQTSDFWYTLQPEGRTVLIHTGQYAQNRLDELGKARAELAAARVEAQPLEETFDEHRWSRFFLVTNTGGHIHRTMACNTTFPTTRWAWLPQLSGLDEDAAVKDQGPRLCSICFPSAPVEWTLGLPKAPQCPGSGLRAKPGYERYNSQPCSHCGKSYPVSRNTGVIRAHKPAKES